MEKYKLENQVINCYREVEKNSKNPRLCCFWYLVNGYTIQRFNLKFKNDSEATKEFRDFKEKTLKAVKLALFLLNNDMKPDLIVEGKNGQIRQEIKNLFYAFRKED